MKVMCTLAIYFKVTRSYPVVIAANRDEFLARPAGNPTTLAHHPHVVGGKDLKAGGTWLGINEYGVVAGLLNRRAVEGANPDVRSRGLLCLDALGQRNAADAARFARAQRGSDYNPFNLLIASREEAWVAHNRDGVIAMVPLTPGLHLLTNLDVDDFECPKISRSYSKFARLGEHAEFRRDPVAMQDGARRDSRRSRNPARLARRRPAQFAMPPPRRLRHSLLQPDFPRHRARTRRALVRARAAVQHRLCARDGSGTRPA